MPEVGLVERIWALYENKSFDLYSGHYVRDYELNLESRLEKCLQAKTLDHQDLTLTALPLTLKTVYRPNGGHRSFIRQLPPIDVMDYLQNAILYHHAQLVPKFPWKKARDGHQAACMFYVYVSKSLHPGQCYPKLHPEELLFSELAGDQDGSEGYDLKIEQLRKRDVFLEFRDGTLSLELDDAIERFCHTLAPRQQNRLSQALEVYREGGGVRVHGVDKRRSDQRKLRQLLTESGFHSEIFLGYDNATNWPKLWIGIKTAYPLRQHLLSPTEKRIMNWVLTRKNGQENLKACLPAITRDLNIPKSSAESLFWRAKRILLNESKNEKTLAANQRHHLLQSE